MMPESTTPDGHRPTLLACFLHFDVSFMLWVLLGALGIYIADDLGLDASQKGLVVAVPILTGSLLRVPLGALSDRIGGTRVGVAMLAFLVLPLVLAWQVGSGLTPLLLIGAMLGVAGASFAVVLPLASRWYPPERQGLVMGIAAAGNSGTVLANLIAPRLANMVGWQNVFGLALVPLILVLATFTVAAKDPPSSMTPHAFRDYSQVLGQKDLWWFCLFYGVTFGGYVGLSSFLPLFLRDQYTVTPLTAGYLTAAVALVGSGIRPIGGYLADGFGGVRVLRLLLVCIVATYAVIAMLPALGGMSILLVIGMACLGMGNGAVFQLVPRRFAANIGVATGVVGAVGGLGGFMLPMLLGHAKQATGSFGPGFFILAVVAFGAASVLQALSALRLGWRLSWRAVAVSRAVEES